MKKFLVVAILIIAGATQHASSMSKLQHGLDGIENRCKNLIPKLANSQSWTKFCHWLGKKAAQVHKSCSSYFEGKPLHEELLKQDEKEDEKQVTKIQHATRTKNAKFLYLLLLMLPSPVNTHTQQIDRFETQRLPECKAPGAYKNESNIHSDCQSSDAYINSYHTESRLSCFPVNRTFDPFNNPPAFLICHPEADGTELCWQSCNWLNPSYDIQGCIVTPEGEALACSSMNLHNSTEPLTNHYFFNEQGILVDKDNPERTNKSKTVNELKKPYTYKTDTHQAVPLDNYIIIQKQISSLIKNAQYTLDKYGQTLYKAPLSNIFVTDTISRDPDSSGYFNNTSGETGIGKTIIKTMNQEELMFIIGHEFGHALLGEYQFAPKKIELQQKYNFNLYPPSFIAQLSQLNKTVYELFHNENYELAADTVGNLLTQPLWGAQVHAILESLRDNHPDIQKGTQKCEGYLTFFERNAHPNPHCRIIYSLRLADLSKHVIDKLRSKIKELKEKRLIPQQF